MKTLGKKAKDWINFRRKYLKDKVDFDGYYLCCHCFRKFEHIEVDHILPRSTHPGLVFDKDNLQLLCHDCHTKKTYHLTRSNH